MFRLTATPYRFCAQSLSFCIYLMVSEKKTSSNALMYRLWSFPICLTAEIQSVLVWFDLCGERRAHVWLWLGAHGDNSLWPCVIPLVVCWKQVIYIILNLNINYVGPVFHLRICSWNGLWLPQFWYFYLFLPIFYLLYSLCVLFQLDHESDSSSRMSTMTGFWYLIDTLLPWA